MQLLDSPDQYLYQMLSMTSSQARKQWKTAIKEHWQCKCAYCHVTYQASELTLDHVKPRSQGGDSLTSNLVPSCRECNTKKASQNWLTFMREVFGPQPQREQLILNWIN